MALKTLKGNVLQFEKLKEFIVILNEDKSNKSFILLNRERERCGCELSVLERIERNVEIVQAFGENGTGKVG